MMRTLFKNPWGILLIILMACKMEAYAANDTIKEKEGYLFRTLLHDKVLLLRENPSLQSPIIDTFKRTATHTIRFLDDLDDGWCRIRIAVPKLFYVDGKPDHYGNEYFTRYVKKSTLLENSYSDYVRIDNTPTKVNIYAKPNATSAVLATENSAYSSLDVVGTVDGAWVKVLANTKESREVQWEERDKHRIFGYVNGEAFRKNYVARVFKPTESIQANYSGKTGLTPEWIALQQEWDRKLGAPLNAEKNFPITVMILMVLMILAPIFTRDYNKWTLAIQYTLMMAIILMELSYILLFGYEFRFCRILGGGFVDGIVGLFFTLLTLVVIYFQYIYFFAIIRWLKTFSRGFNSWIGTTLAGVFVIGMLIYAIFSSLNTSQNETLIYILLGIEALQAVVILLQMLRYPIYGLLAAILIPLGAIAIIMTTLMTFQFMVIVAIIMIIIKGFASISNSSTSEDNSEQRSDQFVDVAKNCQYFTESGFRCTFQMGPCRMCNTGKCPCGQM